MKIDISAFYTAKAGSELKECQDSCSVNSNRWAFAVSDGVTQSLFSDIWSKIITQSYVDNPDTFVQKNGEKVLNPTLGFEFDTQFQEKFDSLGSLQKRFVNISKAKTPYSAATFVGFRMEGRKAVVEALGDSVLFQYRKSDGSVEAVCSMMKNGCLAFDNSPEYFASNGIVNGLVVTKEINVEEGSILVMTDAIAAWFNDQQDKTAAIGQLSKLANHDEYHSFIERLRRDGLKDDDCTILLLNIEEDQKEEVTMNILHLDDGILTTPVEIKPKSVTETDVPNEEQNAPTSILVIIKRQIGELFEKLRNFGDRLVHVESETEMSNKEQKVIKENISNVDKRINDLESLVRDVKKTSEIPVDVLSLDKKIANLEGQMAIVDETVKSISARTKTFDNRLIALEAKIGYLKPSEPLVGTSVSKDIDSRISRIEADISLLKSKERINDVLNSSIYEERIKAVESSIRAIRGDVDDSIKCSNEKDGEILSLKKNITSLNEKLKMQEDFVNILKSEISRLKNLSPEDKKIEFGLGDCIMVSLRRLFSLFKIS